jgi:hypothetical protein
MTEGAGTGFRAFVFAYDSLSGIEIMTRIADSDCGHAIPRRKFIKLASLAGAGIAGANLLGELAPLARAVEQRAASGGVAPKAGDIYVATTGNDKAAGTQKAPFKSLARAQEAVRTRNASGKPVTLWLRGGTYFLTAPLVFGPEDSGTAKAPVTWAAYPNEKVIISGGVKLNPTWSDYSGGIKVATIGTGYVFDMLFLDGDKLLTLARYPNYDPDKVPLQGCADISDRVAKWSNPEGGFIRALHRAEWGGESFRIKGKSGTTLDLEWVGDNNRGDRMNPKEQVAENIFEELDAPGEWFYDKKEGKLYVFPPTDTDLSKSYLVGGTQEELIRVVGKPGTNVTHLGFRGFHFTHTHRTLFTRPYEGLSQGDWCIVRAGAMYLQDAENIEIRDCTFTNIGGNGIFMSGHNENNVVTGCDFVHVGATAVAVVGLPNSTRYYCNWKNDKQFPTDLTPGPASENYPKNITISYCYMFDNGMFEKQTSAVQISISQGVTVSHCTAHHGPRAGINIEDGTFGGHVIEYNDVFDQIRETGDHGPFNSWGRDRWWRRMSGEDARKYAQLDNWQPTTIRNNRFHMEPVELPQMSGTSDGATQDGGKGPAKDNEAPGQERKLLFGVDLDDGSTNYRVYNNLLINCSVKSQHGFDHTITNNIIINSRPVFHQWNLPDMRKVVANNIIVFKTPYYCRTRDFFPNTGKIDNNLFWNSGKPVKLLIDSGAGGEISAAETWKKLALDQHSVTADPQFVNTVKGDYTVRPGSPALAVGFKNFPMDQFGKAGYRVPPGFETTNI